ncbi:MAG TPA: hypothetical protein VHB27_06025, partial [Rhodopila sp.]|nr:hypothetical protein [Rhodopila sp.]
MLDEPAVPSVRLVAAGQGWRVAEVVCRAGPRDRPFEERHDWVTIAAVMTGTFTYRSGTYRSGTYRSGTYRSGTYRSG